MLGPMCLIASLSIGATRTFRVRRVGAADSPGVRAVESEPAAVKVASQQTQPIAELAQRASARLQPSAAAPQPTTADAQPLLSRAATVPPTTVDIELKHNSLVIMWPPMQEEWKHEASARPMLTDAEPMLLSTLLWRCQPDILYIILQVPRSKRFASHPFSGLERVNVTFRRLKAQWAEQAPACKCGVRSILKAAYRKAGQEGVPQRYYFACDNTQTSGCGYRKCLA